MYIKLDSDMNLSVTVNEPIYRGDNLNRKIIYLIPAVIGEISTETAFIYLSYIRADGTADVVILEKMDNKYNEDYYQYTFPITCKLTRYPGEVCSWIQIYAGTPSNPQISKSGECMLYVLESKNMDAYICDESITAVYQMHRELEQTKAQKADNIIYNSDDSTIQLTANGMPIGEKIFVNTTSDATVTGVSVSEDKELIITFSDGKQENLGSVLGKDGAVYVPHVSEQKILTFTVEKEPTTVPEPVDLNPSNEWSGVNDESGGKTNSDYVWEHI